jgi:ABC-type multidrug transport system fused ATPase/permease subunit
MLKDPIHGEKINRVLLKPRFKMELEDKSVDEVLNAFKENLAKNDCKYCSKISGNHIFLDVPKEENHFWSPQMQVEILKNKNDKTIVKGIIGPKPQIWTFFMFVHFIIATLFVVFFVWFYTNWTLNKDYQFQKYMLLILPILSVGLYFFGQSGKRIAYNQMVELDRFLMEIINKK